MPIKKKKNGVASSSFDQTVNNEFLRLVRKKEALQSKLTRFSDFFSSAKLIQPDALKLVEIEMRVKSLETNLLTDFSELQLEMENLDPDSYVSETDEFESLYYQIISEAKQFLLSNTQNSIQSSDSFVPNNLSVKKPGAKLPIIELPKFSGAYEKWLEFRDLYLSLVHNCEYIDPIDKFHYLRSSLEGSAGKCINAINFCAENYNIAWETLCARFENKSLMVHNYLKSLCNIRSIDSDSPTAFRNLVDSISANLKCLQSLGVQTNSWDPIIIYLVTSKLDTSVITEWEKQEFRHELPTLDELNSFLVNHADVLEKINLHKSKPREYSQYSKNKQKSFVSSSNSENDKKSKIACYHCSKPHLIYNCHEFRAIPLPQKQKRVLELKLCKNCLQPGHEITKCKFGHCKHCKEKHHSLLHPSDSNCASVGPSSVSGQHPTQTQGSTCCNYSSQGQVLLATALVNIRDKQGKQQVVRALLDSASMSNFISEKVVNKLGLNQESVNFSVVGIGHSESNVTTACNVQFSSFHEDFKADIRCLVISNITGNIPSIHFDPSKITIPNYVQLADPMFYEPKEIDLLIGADTFWRVLDKGSITLGKSKPVLQKTRLGWVISGPLEIPGKRFTYCNFSRNQDIQNLLTKFWEIEDVSCIPLLSEEESQAEKHFSETHRRDSNGRFIVSVPLKEPVDVLGDSKQTASNQFLQLERKFISNPRLKQMYGEFMSEYEELDHMSPYQPKESEPTFYSPHHGVFREDSATTKLRVVFNCSAKSSSGKSYNSIQLVGPTVQDDLQSILTRFRQHVYVVSADICKMYRQILIEEQYRPLQLIFWRSNSEDALKTFALNTVTYGTASAPFLATRCLKQLAIEHQRSSPQASQVIRTDFYVDDLLSGANTVDEAISLCQSVSSILKSGCFELRKWKSNNPHVLEGIKGASLSTDVFQFSSPEANKTLGTIWSCADDTLSFQISLPQQIKKVTKRLILSETAKVFDILGLVSPVIVTAKILLQSLWLQNLSWDQEVSDELSQRWLQLRSELSELNSLKIPRHVSSKDPNSIELHGFSDASESAYGACIYIRTVDSAQTVHVHLLTSKTRVSPLKTVSIPRLELCAAFVLSQLFVKVTSSLTIQFDKYVLWSDSTVVLAWIRTSPHNLQVFVGNRVKEIQELTNVSNWRYVPSDSNPADILSRGMSAKALKESKLWFSGPPWLQQSPRHWPPDISAQNPIFPKDLPEFKNQTHVLLQTNKELFPFVKFSSLTKLKRVTAYCLRFIQNCQIARELRQYDTLSLDELNSAMQTLVKLAQRESFPNEIQSLSDLAQLHKTSKLLSLTPFLENGVIRVGGRLNHSSFSFDKKHPMVLSSKHRLTYLIMKYEHINLLHCGPSQLLAHVRDNYWPISGKNLAKRVVRECIVCFKFKVSSPQAMMGSLPEPRVSPMPTFLHTGVDYAGPFLIKDRKGRGCKVTKCYLCVFVCLATKAIHLELVTDLSTPAFLETFQRFIARRGKPAHIYSDNGRNFVGANNELKELGEFLISNCKLLKEKLEFTHLINWHFIVAYSPHQGGLWEAGVKSAKHHIKRVISGVLLTFENFYTIVTQIESILNSRPLTPLSTDPNDLEVLTPSHFLIGRSLQSIPYPNLEHTPTNRLSHFQHLERLKQQFWSRWSKEYISQLQERTKWKQNKGSVAVGSMVLIRDDNLPPYKWRLGRICEVHPGVDQIIRVVSIKTTSGVIKRAVTKICPLPIDTT